MAALKYFMQSLSDDDVRVSNHAIDVLGRLIEAESLKRLGEALVRDSDTSVRVRAFMALALRADPTSTQYVEAVLKDENPIIREAAEQFLAAMEVRRAREQGRP